MKHKSSYIICATPRSGSTLFCDLLESTKVTGRPDSFFMREFYPMWASYLNVSVANWGSVQEFDQVYLQAVLEEGAGESQIFGMRLMWESLDDLSTRLDDLYPNKLTDNDRFHAAFGTSHYIHLSRKDKIAQAVSLLRAEQSGLWHIHADGTERERLKDGHAPAYDAKALTKLVAELEENDAAWRNWFIQQKIQPISITYEKLSANPQIILANVLSALGLDPIIAESIEPKTAKLRNKESCKWAERFRAQQLDQSR